MSVGRAYEVRRQAEGFEFAKKGRANKKKKLHTTSNPTELSLEITSNVLHLSSSDGTTKLKKLYYTLRDTKETFTASQELVPRGDPHLCGELE